MDTVSVHLNTASVQPILEAFRAPQAYTGHDGDWVILGYPAGGGPGAATIDVVHQGAGGLRACREYIEQTLRPDNGIYVLVRYDHMVEMGKTVKFAYVSYTAASGIPPMRRALLSTHRGQVQKLLLPHHTSIDTDALSDLDDDSVREKIGGVSGTKSHVSERPVSGAVTTTPWSGTSSLSSTAAHDIPVSIAPKGQLTVAPDLQQALADARAGTLAGAATANDAMWVIARYAGKNTLALLASGSASNGTAGAADWLPKLEANNNNFVFVRLTHQIDKSTTVKYAYVRWQPESVPPMAKSQVSTNKGLYDSLFSPFHVDFQVTAASEINDAMILDKISSAAGTKNNVKAN